MTKNKRTNWARQKANEVNEERLQSTNQWVGIREEQFREHERSDRAVEKKIVPLNGGTNRTGDDRFHQHPAMIGSFCRTNGW
jgi:hypothetical protein